jgi:hypothetical protein
MRPDLVAVDAGALRELAVVGDHRLLLLARVARQERHR